MKKYIYIEATFVETNLVPIWLLAYHAYWHCCSLFRPWSLSRLGPMDRDPAAVTNRSLALDSGPAPKLKIFAGLDIDFVASIVKELVSKNLLKEGRAVSSHFSISILK